ncbi:hypothetical protein CEXT_256671 [Caerostris extrusa]|uniref:Uncharacterized protein n=1 Tax=Caerostris extrusa TaxID=172846 RepID=A0AAV4VTJ3_CAEEX|nr:hypothetical protein CEXT_256671 [Caerostris extrusa]
MTAEQLVRDRKMEMMERWKLATLASTGFKCLIHLLPSSVSERESEEMRTPFHDCRIVEYLTEITTINNPTKSMEQVDRNLTSGFFFRDRSSAEVWLCIIDDNFLVYTARFPERESEEMRTPFHDCRIVGT